jgi:outer membrane biogenesis lipoprotein LolB
MKIHGIALAGIATILLAGCTTMTPEERRAADEETCRSYGFKHRNDAFAECLQRLELDRRAERRANAAALDWDEPMVIYRPVYIRD